MGRICDMKPLIQRDTEIKVSSNLGCSVSLIHKLDFRSDHNHFDSDQRRAVILNVPQITSSQIGQVERFPIAKD
jgi:hypothetical protein